MRYINDGPHSGRAANVALYTDTMVLYTTKKIKKGEELFLDYGPAYWESKAEEPFRKFVAACN